jgi:hypothetical protein
MKLLKRLPHRRGAVMLYTVYLVTMMFVMISVAVDYGHIQMVKTEEQRCADATARGILEAFLWKHTSAFGLSSAMAVAQAGYTTTVATMVSSKNPVDAASGIAVTVQATAGSWYSSSGQPAKFFPNDWTGPLAVHVVVSRTLQTGNPVSLSFPLPSKAGYLVSRKIDVYAQSTAVLPNPIPLNENVLSTYDPWLAGMADTSGASYDDVAPAQSPRALTVIPGATISVTTAVTGQVMHGVGTGLDGPDGNIAEMYWHLKDPPTGAVVSGQGMENNIGDIITPIDSLTGLFLDANPPSAANAPTTVRDYTSQSSRDDPDFNNLELQQPFYIGDGVNSTLATASFLVPSKATRFYMGIMDGFQWHNNSGSFSVNMTEQPPVQIVQ